MNPNAMDHNTATAPLTTSRALIFFAHSPEKETGQKHFGSLRISRKVYSALLEQALEQIRQASTETDFDLIIASDAPERIAAMLFSEECAVNVTFLRQHGADFGDRLNNTVESVSRLGYKEIIAIGSDTPEMSSHEIESAFAALTSSAIVLGKSLDGGVYLLGAQNHALRGLLREIHWQTPSVYAELQHNALQCGFTTHLLKPLADIDTLADLCVWLAITHHSFPHSSVRHLKRFLASLLRRTSRPALLFTTTKSPAFTRPRLRLQSQKAPPQKALTMA